MKILDVPQSGSVGGTTSSRNRFGQYRRTRANPVQPNTAAQVAARASFTNYSQLWRTLTPAERSAWTAYGATLVYYDSLGQAYNPTGLQAYIGAQTLRAKLGQTQTVEVPSGSAATGPGSSLTIAIENGGAYTITIAGLTGGADTNLVIEASPPVSAGRSWNGRYRFMQATTPTAMGTGVNIATAFNAAFGVPPVGSRVFIRVRHVVDGKEFWKREGDGEVAEAN